ncbi:MAG TPA: 1,4-alpha-glucan branching protein GlgB [Gallionellaceae bacterium]|nr:1,4-alpha-glucan branching protein GlgB [Gallionellaceae bacterium]
MQRTQDPLMQAILEARMHDPFSYLGLHRENGAWSLRLFLPDAQAPEVHAAEGWAPFRKIHDKGIYAYSSRTPVPKPCRIRYRTADGRTVETWDPYTFPSSISDHDLHLFSEGRLFEVYRTLGAHVMVQEGVGGTRFAVWAPNAERVSVVGDFNGWDGRIYPMRVLGSSGVWELFIPGLGAGELYKYEIRNRHSGAVMVKTDPYGFSFEKRPGTAAKVCAPDKYQWSDRTWLDERAKADWLHAPMNIYEVHPGSWKHPHGGGFFNFRELAAMLLPYIRDMGFTHIELMPVSEHPLDESWGYQTTGYFGLTSRYGAPDDFRAFVDMFHQAGIGVLLDWVPGHFPRDEFALARFDGTALYEHADPRMGEHQDWGTYIFNYGRNEVRSFLIGSAHYWLSEFHIDGLRVDAVASMLYLDYSRKEGEWLPNRYGGRENLDALSFIRDANIMVHQEFPGAMTIAEESTAWPMVSRPVYIGGLGFTMKWNMGWMNDTLRYFSHDPIHRRYHHNDLTFGQLYAYSENFVLPFSHDEVVHGKHSLLDKMPGDTWQKFANVRLLFTYQMTYPGKKLNFMGNEFGQGREWQVKSALEWQLLDSHWHREVHNLFRDLCHLYRDTPALHELDFAVEGFSWIDCHDADQSVLSYLRWSRAREFVVVALNFTPMPRTGYRIGVPEAGAYHEVLNSDSAYYGGSNLGNGAGIEAEDIPWMGYAHSVRLTLPPLAGIILERAG